MITLKLTLLYFLIDLINGQSLKYCDPVVQNIDPSDFPKLPGEFQTRVEMNFISQSRNSEATILYDSFDKRADVTIREQTNMFRQVYDFSHNEVFTIIDRTCKAKRINESTENYFFGLIQDQQGFNMKPPNFLFHFNNGFPTVKLLGQITKRGIPVSHYQSCQNWPELNANILIDYYFTVADYKPAVSYFNDQFKEIPVVITVKGFTDINQTAQTKREVNNEYSFYDFRPIVERKAELFNLPRGVYCEGQKYKEPFPTLPESFSYTGESILKEFGLASNNKIFYSNKLKTYRIDIPTAVSTQINANEPLKIIHDYNSGVAYVINRNRGNCSFFPIGSLKIANFDEIHLSNGYYTLKSPSQIFLLDDTYVYAGERYERGLLCDVYISNRTDLNLNVNAKYFIVELYFLQGEMYADQSTDQLEQVVPISVHISAPGANYTLIQHNYDFDSRLNRDRFDVSQCFQGKSRIDFGIRFAYPEGVDEESFSNFYGRLLVDDFDEKIMKSFKFYSASPLRIARPRFEPHRRGFIVYSAILDYADPKNHFIQDGKARIDIQKIKHGVPANSAESCAQICLTDSQFNLPLDYKCLSFDVCKSESGGVMCSFYNYTLTTDPAVINNDKPECDHYAKITENFDSADTNALFRMVEEAVVRKEFSLDVKDDKGTVILSFPVDDIFQTTQNTGQNSQSGQSTFFKQFVLGAGNIDYNDTALTNSDYIFRKNVGSSLDNCARLCITEPAFECHVYTYNKVWQECKWSSVGQLFDAENPSDAFFIEKEGTDVFIRDPLYSYIKYPSKVTSIVDYTIADAFTESQCAYKCNNDKKIKCRSFNFCESDDGKGHRCLLSETNIHNIDKDPNVVTTSLCSHFSKRALNDFQLAAHTQLSIKPESSLSNMNVESCAEICVYDDSFFCRSFDFNIETNTCYLYKQNLVDKFDVDLGIKTNPKVSHYSRQYYEKDGVLKKIQPLKLTAKSNLNGGVIFGILITVIIGFGLLGVLIGFIYLKITKKGDLLPVMKFVNPNYSQQVDE